MLDANNRVLLTEAIAPRPGYRLDHALLTTFTLDLVTLMEIPVALTFQEWKASDQESPLSRIAILDAIRRNISQLTVVSQAGFITGPPKGHPLLPLLEPAVHPVVMPESSTFHPKVTLLRYVAESQAVEDGLDEVTYRLVCSSRNLSRSRAWDTIVVLDGSLTAKRQADSRGLHEFVAGVNELAAVGPTGMSPERRSSLELIAEEAPNIEFERPEEVKPGKGNMAMVPIGFGKGPRRPKPIRDDQKRLLVSPFLGGVDDQAEDSLLKDFASEQSILVSRQNELDRVSPDLLERFGEILVLSDLTQEAEEDARGDETPDDPAGPRVTDESRGLHAKLIVEDDGHNTQILIGSPNLSERAFSQNLEFALRLTVSKYKHGVDQILGTDGKTGLRKYLQPYVRAETPDEREEALRKTERSLRTVAGDVIRAGLSLHIEAPHGEESDVRDIWLAADGGAIEIPDGFELAGRPVSVDKDRLATVSPDERRIAEWNDVPVPSITSLIAFEVTTTFEGKPISFNFVSKTTLADPLPEARDRQIVRRLIGSSNQLLAYLAFLLSDSNDPTASIDLLEQVSETPDASTVTVSAVNGGLGHDLPLIEKLVQAVDRDPEAIDSIASIVNELERDEKGRAILEEAGFGTTWRPILEARRERGKVVG